MERVLDHYKLDRSRLCLVFVRGHYLDSMGERGKNDINIYDDACFAMSEALFESWNANTDPSFVRIGKRALAKLDLGRYRFYKGKHRNRYWALRAYPEGAELPCTRDGEPSTCTHINIHKGGSSWAPRGAGTTWSEGCLTIPAAQYPDFIQRVYADMRSRGQSVVDTVLVENRRTPSGQKLFDHLGNQIN